ncbi:MAG: hypothetical protein ACHREM_30550, partial [Polyangiales bacterium]
MRGQHLAHHHGRSAGELHRHQLRVRLGPAVQSRWRRGRGHPRLHRAARERDCHGEEDLRHGEREAEGNVHEHGMK